MNLLFTNWKKMIVPAHSDLLNKIGGQPGDYEFNWDKDTDEMLIRKPGQQHISIPMKIDFIKKLLSGESIDFQSSKDLNLPKDSKTDWPEDSKPIGDGLYYKVATNKDQILVGKTKDDIDRLKKKVIRQNHAHYLKNDGKWEVVTTVGGTHQEITLVYGGGYKYNDKKRGYGDSLYGTEGIPVVDEQVSNWLDGLLNQSR
jgi:hypothetical protein